MNTTKETMKIIAEGVCVSIEKSDAENCYCSPIIECYAKKAIEAFGMCIADEKIRREEAVHFMSLVNDLYNKCEYMDALISLRGILHYGNCYELDSFFNFVEDLRYENDEIYVLVLEKFLLLFLDTDEIDDYLMEKLLRDYGEKQTTRDLN